MKASTKAIHDKLAALGRDLGFVVEREVGDSLLRLRWDTGYVYRPRIDLMWSIPLDDPKRKALAWALGRDISGITHLPVVGIEVEGSQPSTRTMASDVANLAALGAPLGLLVVSEAGEANIYRRAARVVRSVRRSFGDLQVVPMEAAWLDDLSSRMWTTSASVVPAQRAKAPAGGEGRWSKQTRDLLRDAGIAAGFTVVEPYRPPILRATYEWVRDLRKNPLTHTQSILLRGCRYR